MRGAGIAVMAAVGGTLLSPAGPLADAPPAPPKAALDTPATTVPAGKPLKLDSSASVPGAGTIVGHVWDLDGNGSFETDTREEPTAQLTPEKPGPLTVQVRVLDDLGQSSDAKLDLTVTKPKPPSDTPNEVAGTSTGQGQGTASIAARTTAAPELVPPRHLSQARQTRQPRPAARKAPTVTAAASTGVTIKNFAYAPSTTTVNVGDTITWTNKDIAPHTATAKDGSWDTGTINKNKTGSHTFTQAGTFPYICSIHPSMKGTVKVVGSGGSGGSGSNSTGSTGGTSSGNGSGSTASPSSSSSSSSSLPRTGLDIAVLVFIAMCLSGSGASLRRALR